MDLIVAPDGQLRHIYNDSLNFTALGPVRISRASQVEPAASGRWLADLSLVGGPVLGPFSRRADALVAEVAWLEQHSLPAPTA